MKYLYTGIVFCIAFGFYMIKKAFENNLVTHHIKLDDTDMERPLKILFISDIHRRKIPEKWFSSLPDVDLVLIGGDITEKGVPYDRIAHNAALLSSAGDTYFVYGNNDEEVNKEKLGTLLKEKGINILENDAEVLQSHSNIVIAGIGDINYQKDDLQHTLGMIGDQKVILLSHDPRVTKKMKQVAEAEKVKLVLCGHTHGGQIRIFGFGPYQKGRLTKTAKFTKLVSNGYGTTVIPMRLGAKPEVHLIQID
ncbi:metallophosphoesterase [Jeotgalibacillus sp. JSM ZJ347]|uniref:metallophosphoesterase n=1 Tax=Jeotgalibacillus sp. JSM ZJ347 TaxID=3342117 RepID=UPI0035A8B182